MNNGYKTYGKNHTNNKPALLKGKQHNQNSTQILALNNCNTKIKRNL